VTYQIIKYKIQVEMAQMKTPYKNE